MGKREEAKRRKSNQNKSSNLTVILIIAAFAIVAVGMIILTTSKQNKPVATPTNATPIEVVVPNKPLAVQRDGLSMGDPNAKVKVIEFADFQCPACASYWSQLEPTLIEQYIDTGKVYFTYNSFSFLGQGQVWDESSKAAEAAYCANDQTKFWEYRDVIFANHNGENLGVYARDNLIKFAEKLSLDVDAFTSCLDSEKYAQQVVDDSQFAANSGSTFTPSFLVDGKVLNANELLPAIEAALGE